LHRQGHNTERQRVPRNAKPRLTCVHLLVSQEGHRCNISLPERLFQILGQFLSVNDLIWFHALWTGR